MSATITVRVYWAAPEPVETRTFNSAETFDQYVTRLDAMGVRWEA